MDIEKQELPGFFITFEGGEGVGKSTQIANLQNHFESAGISTCATREPGGTPGAEAIRHVLLSGAAEPIGPHMEALLFSAARADHIDLVIKPALERGEVVLCDRFIDSTRVYQAETGNVELDFVLKLEEIACGEIRPDLTFVLDLSPEEGMKRAKTRTKDAKPDRFEKEAMALQKKRREGFLKIAKSEPERCRVIDANGNPEEIAAEIWKHAKDALAANSKLELQ